MCEPAHSVVQYPTDYDDTNLPFSGQMTKEARITAALGKALGWSKKIGKWLHLSRFGAGHAKAQMVKFGNERFLPSPHLYEGYWWKRDFHFDGWVNSPEGAAFDAAKTYHKASVIGNMSLFRRFLETSMRKTTHPFGASVYVTTLIDHVFTSEGVNKLLVKFRRVFGVNQNFECAMGAHSHIQSVERGIKVVMGFTRQRRLFLPHFADDDSLWVPGCRAER